MAGLPAVLQQLAIIAGGGLLLRLSSTDMAAWLSFISLLVAVPSSTDLTAQLSFISLLVAVSFSTALAQAAWQS